MLLWNHWRLAAYEVRLEINAFLDLTLTYLRVAGQDAPPTGIRINFVTPQITSSLDYYSTTPEG